MRARAFLPVIALVLLATAEGSGQVVIDMPAPKGDQSVEPGTVALSRYVGARDAPLYGYVSPVIAWPWYRYGFGFPHFGFGYGWGWGYGYSRCVGGFWGYPYGWRMVRRVGPTRPFR